jgi:hypothetical protein
MVTELQIKIPKYECENCDIRTNNKKDFEKHLLTAKHLKIASGDKNGDKGDKNKLTCVNCNKVYKSRNGLWKHSKLCDTYNKSINEPHHENIISLFIKENTDFKNIILDMVKNNGDLQKQNQDLQNKILDVCKNSNTTNNTTNNNSHNKNFNLNFFLNEQCKDAMNIMDFVNTFQLQFSDFEKIGEVGYVQGISNIIIDKLNEMDIYKRPIHCTDAKRETMHIKDNNVWSKDTINNDKLRLAIKYISKKNSDMIRPWLVKHPGALYSDHHLSDNYQMMIIESMGGNTGTLAECETKIIKKISKMVLIDKHM